MRAVIVVLALLGCKKDESDPDGTATDPVDAPVCDVDVDGALAVDCGGDDCDDGAADTFPGAADADSVLGEQVGVEEGHQLAILVADDGTVWVAAGGNSGLQVAQRTEAGWAVTEVAMGLHYYVSLALGPDGNPHVASAGASSGLYYAALGASGWTMETVAAGPRIDANTAIAVTPDGAVHIAYQEYYDDRLVYIGNAGGSWTSDDLGPGGLALSMLADASGELHLVHVHDGDMTYGSGGPDAWSFERVAEGYALDSALSVVGGDVSVGWVLAGGGMHVARGPGSWGVTLLSDDDGVVALDTLGVPYGLTDEAPTLVRWDGAEERVPLDWGSDAGAIFVDAAGDVHAVYPDDDGVVRYTRYAWPDGIDQDCDAWADGRSGLDPALRTADLGAEDVDALCAWATDTTAGADPETCTAVVTDADCAERVVMCPTVGAFEACELGVAWSTCDLEDRLAPSCAGCRSALDPELSVAELTHAHWEELCTWSAAIAGGEGREFTCPDGRTQISPVEECVAAGARLATCDLTVDDIEQCSLAIARDPCEGLQDPGCDAMLSCLMPY